MKFINETNKVYLKNKLTLLEENDLKNKKKKKKKNSSSKNCWSQYTEENKLDNQVRLRCRQLPNVIQELRKTILRQDWNETISLLMILCNPGLKLYSSIIIKVSIILLFCHSKSNFKLLVHFLRCATGYVSNKDIIKFIKILCILRNNKLKTVENGKFLRSTTVKVTKDIEFSTD
ncbi:hypothetical protein Phum_PHUM228370 [Pediculus humanus corporis]|uniref:Uncharacterized protein n=1 Tax=Pediculus humanus subsp. corporis TaxID=121224 RepID=E0VIJ4_PEDHC|nr:uncharacterized protein Phum_PHUM228370 [Pediculus humanus corporis]EEB13200.1 hypothetical protein Phum_PHUM228370 [Pediculus humanus corporis]